MRSALPDTPTPCRVAGAMAALPLLVGLLSACTGVPLAQSAAPSTSETLVITDLRGHRIDVRAGQPFEIRLPSTPSTGYRWTLTDPIPATVRQDGEPRYEQAAQPMPGAPGVEIWRFVGAGPGQGTLRFEYRRPWEPATVPPAQRTRYRVEVR